MTTSQRLLIVFALSQLLAGCATSHYEPPPLLLGKGATLEGKQDAFSEIGIYKIDGKYVDRGWGVRWASDANRSDHCLATAQELAPGKHTVTVNYVYQRDHIRSRTLEQALYELWLVAEPGKQYRLCGTPYTQHRDQRLSVWIEELTSFTEKDTGGRKVKEYRRCGGLVGSADEPKVETPGAGGSKVSP
jgi:hypothetical protein